MTCRDWPCGDWRGIFVFSWNVIKATAKNVIVILWLSFSALFLTADALTPFANMGFGLLWVTYDIITVKFSNIHVVVDALDTPVRPPASNPELRFGIGQIPGQTLRPASGAAAVQGVDTSHQMDPAHVRLRRVETTNEM